MSYDVLVTPAATRQIKKLSDNIQKEIFAIINLVAHNPRPAGCVKLKTRNEYRLRVSAYRVIYEVHDDRLLIKIIKVAHRKEAYKK